jgi:hypothetical protein
VKALRSVREKRLAVLIGMGLYKVSDSVRTVPAWRMKTFGAGL